MLVRSASQAEWILTLLLASIKVLAATAEKLPESHTLEWPGLESTAWTAKPLV